jgi:hypothetical protein
MKPGSLQDVGELAPGSCKSCQIGIMGFSCCGCMWCYVLSIAARYCLQQGSGAVAVAVLFFFKACCMVKIGVVA